MHPYHPPHLQPIILPRVETEEENLKSSRNQNQNLLPRGSAPSRSPTPRIGRFQTSPYPPPSALSPSDQRLNFESTQEHLPKLYPDTEGVSRAKPCPSRHCHVLGDTYTWNRLISWRSESGSTGKPTLTTRETAAKVTWEKSLPPFESLPSSSIVPFPPPQISVGDDGGGKGDEGDEDHGDGAQGAAEKAECGRVGRGREMEEMKAVKETEPTRVEKMGGRENDPVGR